MTALLYIIIAVTLVVAIVVVVYAFRNVDEVSEEAEDGFEDDIPKS